MASTFTTNLRVEKPAYNEQADTWGATLDTGFDRFDACLGGAIYGLTLSTAGSSATFGIAAGGANGMSLASAYTKTTSAWAVGTGNGSLDTGAIANSTWYHIWLIERVDVSPAVADVLISLSATAPTLPTNYTRKRRIGAMKTNGSAQWTSFTQLGDRFLWAVNVIDVAGGSTLPNSSAQLTTLTVPTGVQVDAEFIVNPGYSSTADYWLFTSPDQTDSTPTSTLNDVKISSSFIGQYMSLSRRTNTSAQIRLRAINSGGGTASGPYGIITQGWTDPRGRY